MEENEYEGKLKNVLSNTIYLNINDLKDGNYVLNIIHKNKVIRKITFNKT